MKSRKEIKREIAHLQKMHAIGCKLFLQVCGDRELQSALSDYIDNTDKLIAAAYREKANIETILRTKRNNPLTSNH